MHEDEVQAEHNGDESAAGGDDTREVVEIKRAEDLDFGYCCDVSFMVRSHPARHRSLRRSLSLVVAEAKPPGSRDGNGERKRTAHILERRVTR